MDYQNRKYKQERYQQMMADNDSFIQNITIDCVVIGFHEGIMKILLNRYKDSKYWMLPRGYIMKDENLEDAVKKIIQMRTGLENIYLQHFGIFGDTSRYKPDQTKEIISSVGEDFYEKTKNFFMKRFIGIGYIALIDYTEVKIVENIREELYWCDVNEIPELYSDHNQIIENGLQVIRQNVGRIPIGSELLPNKFTMTQLRTVYEAILGKELDRRNFQRKMLSTGLVIKLDEMDRKPGIKPSNLFSFNCKQNKEGYSLFD